MAKIKLTLKVDDSYCHSMDKAAITALKQTAEDVHTDSIQAQVMPFDTGSMQNEHTFVQTSKGGRVASVIAQTPYAARLYFHPEYNFQHIFNKNAQGRWWEPWSTGNKQKDVVQNFMEHLREAMPK